MHTHDHLLVVTVKTGKFAGNKDSQTCPQSVEFQEERHAVSVLGPSHLMSQRISESKGSPLERTFQRPPWQQQECVPRQQAEKTPHMGHPAWKDLSPHFAY